MKLLEHTETEKTLDRLPDLPPGVEVPDDISGLEPPATAKPRTAAVRWMRWLTAIVLLGGAGALAAVLLTGSETTDETPVVDYMTTYGTDNPAFVEGGAGPGTVEIVAPTDYMALYGTDNPTFVPEVTDTVDTGEYMALYGTDNPDFTPEPTYMDLYGTDNPDFVEP